MTKLSEAPPNPGQDDGPNSMEDSDSQLIIGLDFGTTFSGIAYIFTEQNKPDPEAVTDWPGTPGLKVPKTPTLIDYTAKGGKAFTWGSNVDTTSKGKLEGVKLLLDPDQPVPLYVPAMNTKKELQKLGKPPLDVASDYLEALYKHALGSINASYPKDFVDMQQKRFVLTVPAVWSDKAKDLTLKVYLIQLCWSHLVNLLSGCQECRNISCSANKRARSRCVVHTASSERQSSRGRSDTLAV